MKIVGGMRIHNTVLTAATEVAKKSDVVRGKVGAVCFTNTGNILAFAHNKVIYGQTHKKQWTIHAEIALLAKLVRVRAASRYGIKNLNILVVRYKPEIDGLAIAKPCVNCRHYLNLTGIKVCYSDNNGNIKVLPKGKK